MSFKTMPAKSTPLNRSNTQENPPELSDALSRHFRWYRKHFSQKKAHNHSDIQGLDIEPMQKLTRLALDIPVWLNLFRRFGDASALSLKNNDIHLLQIAILFISLSSSDGKSHHSHAMWIKTATNFYRYTTQVLQAKPRVAKVIAEAIGYSLCDKNYFALEVSKNNKIIWVKKEQFYDTIYNKIIGDVLYLDTLEMRHLSPFKADQLHFYISIAHTNSEAFDVLMQLITEVRSLIEKHQEQRDQEGENLIADYHYENGFQTTIATMLGGKVVNRLYHTLYADNQVMNSRELRQVGVESVSDNMIFQKPVLVRGIAYPSVIFSTKDSESSVALEIRKIGRRPGVSSRTTKPNRLEKYGNPDRSTTCLPSLLYAGQGFLIINPSPQQVAAVYEMDSDTGLGKHKRLRATCKPEEKTEHLQLFHRKIKMGLSIKKRVQDTLYHNEVICTITEVNAVYFTREITSNNWMVEDHESYLKALYIQQEYALATGVELPIYEYSFFHNYLKLIEPHSDEKIIQMWEDVILRYILEFKVGTSEKYIVESLDFLKIKAIDPIDIIHKGSNNAIPVDSRYLPKLLEKINSRLLAIIRPYQQVVIQDMQSNVLSVFSNDAFEFIIHYPSFIYPLLPAIRAQGKQYWDGHLLQIKEEIKAINIGIGFTLKDLYATDYFKSNISKIYFYSKIFNFVLTKMIQKKAREVIDDSLEEIIRIVGDTSSQVCLTRLPKLFWHAIEKSIRFDLLDEYREKFNACLKMALPFLIHKRGVFGFQILVDTIQQSGLSQDGDTYTILMNRYPSKEGVVVAKNTPRKWTLLQYVTDLNEKFLKTLQVTIKEAREKASKEHAPREAEKTATQAKTETTSLKNGSEDNSLFTRKRPRSLGVESVCRKTLRV